MMTLMLSKPARNKFVHFVRGGDMQRLRGRKTDNYCRATERLRN